MLDMNSMMMNALRQRRRPDGPDIQPMPQMQPPPPPPQQEGGIGEALLGALGTVGGAYMNRPKTPSAPKPNLPAQQGPLPDSPLFDPGANYYDDEVRKSLFGSLLGSMSGFRHGGRYDPHKPFIAGEEGPEVVDPESQTVLPTDALMKALQGNADPGGPVPLGGRGIGSGFMSGESGGMPDETMQRLLGLSPSIVDKQRAFDESRGQGSYGDPLPRREALEGMLPAPTSSPASPLPQAMPQGIPGLEEALRGAQPPSSMPTGESRQPSMRMGKPPLSSEERSMGIEREEDTPSRLRAAIVTALQGIAQAGQIPGVTVGQTLAGGIQGLGGAINPEILNTQVQERNRQRRDVAQKSQERQADIDYKRASTEEKRAEAQARRTPKPAKRDYKAMGGKWYLIGEDGKREAVTDENGKPLSDEQYDVQTFQNGDAIIINKRTGETVRNLGNFAKGDDSVPKDEKEYGEKTAKLKASAAAARSRAQAARAQKKALDASDVDPEEKRDRYESLQDEIDKAEADATQADTELQGLPKPMRSQMTEAVKGLKDLSPSEASEWEKMRDEVLAIKDPVERDRHYRLFLGYVTKKQEALKKRGK